MARPSSRLSERRWRHHHDGFRSVRPMTRLIPIDNGAFVSGQIAAADVAEAAALGVTLIVNNRPDGEEPGQPSGAEIEAAAAAAGLEYRHIPVSGGFSQGQVAEMAGALDEAEGKVLAFCRSGTR